MFSSLFNKQNELTLLSRKCTKKSCFIKKREMLWSVMCDSGTDRQKLICYGQRDTLNSMVGDTCKISC